jgi:hypothetical protein
MRGLLGEGDYYRVGQLVLDYDEWVSRESGADGSIAELLSG